MASVDGTQLPLAGVTIADFSWVLAGPRCTSWLGAMGARVIKIEGPQRPDQYRSVAIFEPGYQGIDGSAAFHNLNFSKLDCTIDFTHPKGLALAKKVIAISDVVIENFAYGVMEKVGLTYEVVRGIRPDIIMVSSSAVGKTGPDRAYVAYGNLLHSFAGLNKVTGHPGDSGASLGGTYTDPLTGNTLVLAILAALWNRRMTGEGCFVDVSMVEATMMQLPEFIMDYTANGRVAKPEGNIDGLAAPHNCYPCRGDDQWVAIAVYNQAGWEAFCGVLAQPTWAQDPRFRDPVSRYHNREGLDVHVADWTRERTAEEVTILLQDAGVAAGPSYNSAQMYQDEQLNDRGFFVQVEHPVSGLKPIMRLPWRQSPGIEGRYFHAPLFGQHNDLIFHDILGLSKAEIDELKAERVIIS